MHRLLGQRLLTQHVVAYRQLGDAVNSSSPVANRQILPSRVVYSGITGKELEKSIHVLSAWQVISDPTLQRKGVKLLLVCNKTDEGARAHTADFIRKRLEKELEALRGTRSTLGEGVSKGQPIAKAGEVFTFAGLRSPAVTVVSGSALRADLDELLKHLR